MAPFFPMRWVAPSFPRAGWRPFVPGMMDGRVLHHAGWAPRCSQYDGWPRYSARPFGPALAHGLCPLVLRRRRQVCGKRGKRGHTSYCVSPSFRVPPDCDGPVLPGAMGGPAVPHAPAGRPFVPGM